ncbi:MAG: putative lipopolysaccharide heptosyltransferase III [Syntrophales bacterium]|nr:putative lipopolysaccharide heptosyltransferase III [Syntrophales bacterium]
MNSSQEKIYCQEKRFDPIRILIIQLGDIGDVVWVTPTLWAIREAYPQAKVSVLLREDNGTLLEADPSVHRIFAVKRRGKGHFKKALEQIRFIKILQRERFDLVFDLRADDRGAIMAYLSRAPVRVAQYYDGLPFWRNRLFTHLVLPPPVKEKNRGAAEQSLRIVRGVGIEAKTTIPRLFIAEQTGKQVQQLLDAEKIGAVPWITLNPFSRWRYKEWGHSKWAQIIAYLWDEFHIATVVVGAEAERTRAAELAETCRGAVYNLAGKTTLAELAGLLRLSALHLGVDSAAPHIAAAVGTPTVTIYGPSDWREWAPVGEQHRVVLPPMECVPCRQKGCDGKEWSRCLEILETGQVKEVIREALGQVFSTSN